MREIKFRAWDKVKNEYVYEEFEYALRLFDLDYQGPPRCPCIGFPEEEWKRFNIEQYTEYKDSNGKQICEGDIVSFDIQDYHSEHVYTLPVEYVGAAFGFRYKSNPALENSDCFISLAEAVANDDDLEIVGNIHENMSLKLGRD